MLISGPAPLCLTQWKVNQLPHVYHCCLFVILHTQSMQRSLQRTTRPTDPGVELSHQRIRRVQVA